MSPAPALVAPVTILVLKPNQTVVAIAGAQQGGSGGGHHNKGNSANQGITQGQSNNQNANCVSGSSTSGSCNNTKHSIPIKQR